jgi:cytochrome P450
LQEVTIGGYRIPAGTDVLPQIASVLSDPAVYEEPDEFRPERFLLADMKTANKEALDNVRICFADNSSKTLWSQLVPFSLGKRQCLGESLARAELFILFVSCIQKYTFTAIPGQPMPSNEPVIGGTAVPIKYKMRVNKN